jgi:hypothetical protein
MTTPRQLDGYMHGIEQIRNESAAGDWQDAMDSTAGSMGGESARNVVRVVIVVGGGARISCDRVSNGGRTVLGCFWSASTKNHIEKKAVRRFGHVYLGTDSGKKSSGWTSWCMPIEVFGWKGESIGSKSKWSSVPSLGETP